MSSDGRAPTLHEERVLSVSQRRVLRRIGQFTWEHDFYLGGGTAVALQLGHRRSEDFDWFTSTPLARPLDLSAALRRALGPGSASFTAHDVAPGTLHGLVGRVNVSFLELRYRRLRPLLEWREVPCRVASLDDLACMKLGAAVQRGSRKDFVDVYALGTAHRPLRDLLRLYRRKFEIDDIGHVLVGLSYFDDAERTPMPRMLWRVSWRAIRTTIESWVKETSG